MPTRESEPKIRFPDDPLNFEDGVAVVKKELLDSIPDNVRRILQKKRRTPEERVEIIQFLHVCLKDAPYKNSEEILAFFSRDFLSQFSSELLLISKERTVRFQLRAMAERVLSEDSFIKRYINSDGKPEDIISGRIASPIFTWYIETAFMSLEKTIRRISNYAPQPEVAIKNLIRLGILYGKFNSLTDTREPNTARVYYRYLLSPYISADDPVYMQKYCAPVRESELQNPPELVKLKEFWLSRFLPAVAAKNRTSEGDSAVRVINPTHLQHATREIGIDTSVSPFQDPQTYGEHILMRTQGIGHRNLSVEQQRAAYEMIRKTAGQKLTELEDSFQEITTLYGGRKFLNRSGGEKHFSKHVSKMRNVIPLIFQKYIELSIEASKHPFDTSIFIQTTHAIFEEHEVPIEAIFGNKFASLPEIEQTCLLLFFGLTFMRRDPKLRLNVIGFLQKKGNLLEQLDSHHVLVPPVPSPISREISSEISMDSTAYRNREINVLCVQKVFSPYKEKTREELMKRIWTVFSLSGINSADLFEPINLADKLGWNIFLFFSGISFSQLVLSLSIPQVDPKLPFAFAAAVMVETLAADISFRKKTSKEFSQNRIKQFEILSPEYEEKAKELRLKKKTEQKRSLSRFLRRATVLFTIGFLGLTAIESKIKENGSFSSASSRTLPPQTASVPTAIPMTMPDRIDPSSLEQTQPMYWGELLHTPVGETLSFGQDVGYEPLNWYVHDGALFNDKFNVLFGNTIVVPEIDPATLTAKSNEMEYELFNVPTIVQPFNGEKIDRVVQEGGSTPFIGNEGELLYSSGVPKRLVIFASELQKAPGNTSRVQEFPEFSAEAYDPWINFNFNNAKAFASKLKKDSNLENLYLEFINQLQLAIETYSQDSTPVEEQFQNAYSNVIEDFAIHFAQYIDSNRYYSLGFTPSITSGEFPALQSIADQPDSGFYCADAALAFSDFFTAANIKVYTQPGNSVYDFNNDLYTYFGHENNVLHLPNGKLLFVDITPKATSKTPQGDINALKIHPPAKSHVDTPRAIEQPTFTPNEKEQSLQTIEMFVASSLSLIGGVAVAKMFWRKRKQTQMKLTASIKEEPIQDVNGAGMLGLLLTADFYTDADYAPMFGKLLYTDTDFTKENIRIIAHDVFELAINSTGPRRLTASAKRANIKTATPTQVMHTIPSEQRDTVQQGVELLLSELERLTARHQDSLSLEQIENVSCIQEFLREGIAS